MDNYIYIHTAYTLCHRITRDLNIIRYYGGDGG